MEISKQQLIEDIQRLNKAYPGNVTRNFYRANGLYPESKWQVYFPTFEEFLKAANVERYKAEDVAETNERTEDSWSISLPKTRIYTLEQLVEYCQIDLNVWQVDKFIANKWEVGARNDKGDITVEPLFQIKAFLTKKKDTQAIQNEIEELKALAKNSAPVPKKIIRDGHLVGNMLEINIPDAHFGKLAWGVETGHENYDTKIARKMFVTALDTLVHRTAAYQFDEIVFVVGNDILNSDDLESRTTKGTTVTTDGRYQKTFSTVRTTMVECVERLRQIAPVKVIMIPGNHDELSVWHLGDSLECYFHNYDDVVIDNEPKYRKYHEYGKVMLMMTHGDKGKRGDYPLLMATEQPEMFGRTKFREAHTGHTHMTKLDEQHGVRVRVLPALCPPDDWHSANGYVGNLRNAEAYIWNKEEGLIGMAIYSDLQT